MWFGYVSFGYIADAIGRKRAYVIFVLMASLLLPLYGVLREPGCCCCWGRSSRSSAPDTTVASAR